MTLTFSRIHDMTPRILKDLQLLEQRCNQHEGLQMKLNWPAPVERKAWFGADFGAFDNGKLIGYLIFFLFGDTELEMTAMVDPDFRRKGVFRALMQEACIVQKSMGIPSFLAICERKSEAGLNALEWLRPKPDHSEYLMALHSWPNLEPDNEVRLEPISEKTLTFVAEKDCEAFGSRMDEVLPRLRRSLESKSEATLVAYLGDKPVGKLRISDEPEGHGIWGFAVSAELRGRGIGTRVLKKSLARIEMKSGRTRVFLEVVTENTGALKIYERVGFVTESVFDYYRI